MARTKRTSTSIDNLKQRFSGMMSIDPKLDLGNGITTAEAETLIKTGDVSLQDYNTILSVCDDKQYSLETIEKKIDKFSTAILSSVALKYGKDSIEYEQVGGTRTSDIKRKNNKKKPKSPP
ncbi:hypothetical protein [uncultured Acetobacteroides sp.]|uniref:hypothetical protein n=1 Tax=uncultured Acetobacteroides sp. TaxID=1760811 RepID=UPI0029F5AAE8|nr:hypothetical protein [uncultured Acetobacteroides sp.]